MFPLVNIVLDRNRQRFHFHNGGKPMSIWAYVAWKYCKWWIRTTFVPMCDSAARVVDFTGPTCFWYIYTEEFTIHFKHFVNLGINSIINKVPLMKCKQLHENKDWKYKLFRGDAGRQTGPSKIKTVRSIVHFQIMSGDYIDRGKKKSISTF